jgi:hypothetical protein
MSGLREWAKKKRLTAKMIGDKIGVTSTIIYRHYNGARVSDNCLAGYKNIGVPSTIYNNLFKQGL